MSRLSQLDYSGPPAPATGDDTAVGVTLLLSVLRAKCNGQALDAEVTKERRRLKRYTRAVEEHEGQVSRTFQSKVPPANRNSKTLAIRE